MDNKLESGTRDRNIGSRVSITYYGSWPLYGDDFEMAKSEGRVVGMVWMTQGRKL